MELLTQRQSSLIKTPPNNAALQGPAPQTQGSWAARADYALSNPTVVGRVAELTPILPQVKQCTVQLTLNCLFVQVPTKELHAIFQTIVEKVGIPANHKNSVLCLSLV